MKFIGCWILIAACSVSLFGQDAVGKIDKVDNKNKAFTLIRNDTINDAGIPVLKYKVQRNADKRIIMEGSVTMGMLDWTADFELTETRSLGNGQSTQNQRSRKIDLRPYLIN